MKLKPFRADGGDIGTGRIREIAHNPYGDEEKCWLAKRVLALLDELEAKDKRNTELEAVKCKLSDSKLLSLAKDIVENLVDTGGSDPEYTRQYIDWTCKRIRIAAAGKGE